MLVEILVKATQSLAHVVLRIFFHIGIATL